MGLLMQLGVPMSIGMEGRGDLTSFALFAGMWAVMMVAMMLPSSFPTFMLHRSIYTNRYPDRRGGALFFALGYFFIWSATAALFYAGYILLGYLRGTAAAADSAILRMAGMALIIAGLYQWSRLKSSCLRHCQSPLGFLMHHWRDGRLGAVRMGADHGIYCFGCCWGLMLVLFTMGVMHLGWMAAVSVLILVEKLTPSATWVPKLAGSALVAMGALVLLYPDLLSSMSSHVTLR
jgi:predicted metal-binding membrane protein